MTYGAFHLKDHIGPQDTYVSTMFDDVDRSESGPFETCIFRMPGHTDLPEFHWRTQEMAESAHRKFVWLINQHQPSGGLVTGPVDDSQWRLLPETAEQDYAAHVAGLELRAPGDE